MTRLRGRASRSKRLVDNLNPIEMVFAKTQQLLRALACRTRNILWQSMQAVLDAVTPGDAENRFRHTGYTLHVD